METRIEEYKEAKRLSAEMRKKKRGTPISEQELVNMIEDVLSGDTLKEISERYYRSQQMIKNKLRDVGALIRSNASSNPADPHELPDECIDGDIAVGDIVYVPGYGCFAEVDKDVSKVGYTYKAFRVYLLDQDQQRYVSYFEYDLGSVKHLIDLGVNIDRVKGSVMNKDSMTLLMNEALRAANMRSKEEN